MRIVAQQFRHQRLRATRGGKVRLIEDCPDHKGDDFKMAPFTFSRSIPGCQLGVAFTKEYPTKTVDAFRLLQLTFLEGLTPHMGGGVSEPKNDPFENHRKKILESGVLRN